MPYKFDWSNFTSEDFVNYCAMMENDQLYADDYVGCVRVGDLCFDLVLRCYDDENLVLTYDLYVGGMDTGYGYSNRCNETPDYPYDFAEGGDWFSTCIYLSYEGFKLLAEESFKDYIEHSGYTLTHSLIDRAKEPLHIW